MSKNYRATIVRRDGSEEDWGFFDIRFLEGALVLRTLENTPQGAVDTMLAPGEWREVRDIMEES